MTRIASFFLAWLAVSATAQATGFDCRNAESKVEKLICATPALSRLDDKLNARFKDLIDDSNANGVADNNEIWLAQQRGWLKQTRNQCVDAGCLAKVYAQRIKELDTLIPWATGTADLTCDIMRKFPKMVFAGDVFLGSGAAPKIGVDYDCPENLKSLPFLRKLRELAETIRSEGTGNQACDGEMGEIARRNYYFNLARAGFAPQFLKDDNKPTVLNYFEQWSWESPYNRNLYQSFFAEFDQALPLLTDRYRKFFALPEQQANSLARTALMMYVNRAAGIFSSGSLHEEGKLIDIVRKGSAEDMISALAALPSGKASKDQAYYALKAALYDNRPEPLISVLLDYIGPIDDKKLAVGDESALFAALFSPHYVKLLLDKGESIDHANSFGKTVLFYAIQSNDHKMVELLLQRGADVNHAYRSAHELNPDNQMCSLNDTLRHTRRTPLMHAAQHADVEMLMFLLKNGAHLHDVDELGFNAIDYAKMGNKPNNREYLSSQ